MADNAKEAAKKAFDSALKALGKNPVEGEKENPAPANPEKGNEKYKPIPIPPKKEGEDRKS